MAGKKTVTSKRQEELQAAINETESAMNRLQSLFEEMDEVRSNMEEKFGQTEKYGRLEELCSTLENAKEEISTALDTLNGVELSYT